MKVKKFVAPSMPEAMKMIRSELGTDAVILNSKIVHSGGFFGFFTKKSIEVIAAIDAKPTKEERRARAVVAEERKQPVQQTVVTPPLPQVEEKQLLQEIQQLKSMMETLAAQPPVHHEQYAPPLQAVYQKLLAQELEQEHCKAIMAYLTEKWYVHKAAASEDALWKWVKEWTAAQLAGVKFGGISYKKKYINVVGPTGVGKTTTLAKVAAQCVLKDNKRVAFITTDTYRIAAIDQLKTYAKILNIPLQVCYNLEDFRKAKEKFADYDVILVDTAGRNFRNKQYVEEMKQMMVLNDEMETYLVLSCTTKQVDMVAIAEQFSIVSIDKFIFTKLDETETYGAIFNLAMKYNRGIAYMTNGQNVPEDIRECSSTLVVNTLFGVDRA